MELEIKEYGSECTFGDSLLEVPHTSAIRHHHAKATLLAHYVI